MNIFVNEVNKNRKEHREERSESGTQVLPSTKEHHCNFIMKLQYKKLSSNMSPT